MTSWFTPREAARDRGFQITQSLVVIAALGWSIYAGHLAVANPGGLMLPAMMLAGALLVLKVEWIIYALPIAVAVPRGEILPLGLNPTQFLLGVLGAGLALRWTTGRFRGQRIDPVAVLLGALVLWPALLFIVGYWYKNAWLVLRSLMPAPLTFLLGRYVIRTDNQIRRLTAAIAVGGFVLLAGLGWFFFTDPKALDLTRQQQFLSLRSSDLSPFLGSGLWIGLLIAPLSVASIWLLRANLYKRLAGLSVVTSVAVLSTLVNARAGWLVTALALILASLGLPQQGLTRWRKIALAGLVAALIGWVLSQFFSGALTGIEERMLALGNPENLLNRVPTWTWVLHLAVQRPLLGWGLGFLNSHGLFLDFAAGFGFPYAFTWLVVMGIVFRRVWWLTRCKSNESAIAALCLTMVVGFAYSLFVTTFMGDPMFTSVYWLIAGAVSHQYACLPGGENSDRWNSR